MTKECLGSELISDIFQGIGVIGETQGTYGNYTCQSQSFTYMCGSRPYS